jgi:hypothetical protein
VLKCGYLEESEYGKELHIVASCIFLRWYWIPDVSVVVLS